jgi:hypothetical protein
MIKSKLNKLSNELRAVGAKDTEVGPLLTLAEQLHRLPDTGTASRLPFTTLAHFPSRLALAGFGALAGLLVGGALVMAAQTSLPDGWLYPVKQLSEQTAVALRPDYKATVMMHRAQEVHTLIDRHTATTTVLATLAAYNREADDYRSNTSSYAAFEYCKTELQQAEKQAGAQERQALQATLAALPDAG